SDSLGELHVRASCVEHALLDTARVDRQLALTFLAGDGDTTSWQVRTRLWETAQKLNARAALDALIAAAEASPVQSTALRVGLPAIHAHRCASIFWHGQPVADLLQRDRGFEIQLYAGEHGDNPARHFLRGRHSCGRDFAPPAIEHLCTPGLFSDPVRRRHEARMTLERVFRGNLPIRLLGGLSIGRTGPSTDADRHGGRADPLVTHSSDSTFQGRLVHNWMAGRRRFEALETMFLRGLPVDPRSGAWIPVNLDDEGGVRVATGLPWTHSLLIPGLPGFSVELHVLSGALLKAIGLPVPETRLLPLGDGQMSAIAARPDVHASRPRVLPAVESLAAMAAGSRTRLVGSQGLDRSSHLRMASVHGGQGVVAHVLALATAGYVMGTRAPDMRDALLLARVGGSDVERSFLTPTGLSIDATALSVRRVIDLREFATRVAAATGGSPEHCLRDTVDVVSRLGAAVYACPAIARELPVQWKMLTDALALARASVDTDPSVMAFDTDRRLSSGLPTAPSRVSARAAR
ncbi:MAG: hypothetical protein ACPG1A_10880, partial [Halioglobus sp.]